MGLAVEFAKTMIKTEKLMRQFANAQRVPEAVRDEIFSNSLEVGQLASHMANADYSEDPVSDFQLLAANSFFRTDVALLGAGHEGNKELLRDAKSRGLLRDMQTSTNALRASSMTRAMGIDQLSHDSAFRQLLAKKDPTLLAELDKLVKQDQTKPTFQELNVTQKRELIQFLTGLTNVGNELLDQIVATVENTREIASKQLLADLQSKVPAYNYAPPKLTAGS